MLVPQHQHTHLQPAVFGHYSASLTTTPQFPPDSFYLTAPATPPSPPSPPSFDVDAFLEASQPDGVYGDDSDIDSGVGDLAETSACQQSSFLFDCGVHDMSDDVFDVDDVIHAGSNAAFAPGQGQNCAVTSASNKQCTCGCPPKPVTDTFLHRILTGKGYTLGGSNTNSLLSSQNDFMQSSRGSHCNSSQSISKHSSSSQNRSDAVSVQNFQRSNSSSHCNLIGNIHRDQNVSSQGHSSPLRGHCSPLGSLSSSQSHSSPLGSNGSPNHNSHGSPNHSSHASQNHSVPLGGHSSPLSGHRSPLSSLSSSHGSQNHSSLHPRLHHQSSSSSYHHRLQSACGMMMDKTSFQPHHYRHQPYPSISGFGMSGSCAYPALSAMSPSSNFFTHYSPIAGR